jgi:hypothetical protein
MTGQDAPEIRTMKIMVPPLPPPVALADPGGSDRLRLRLHQVTLSAITVLLTAWCVTLGAVYAVIALSIAKHVLVAILVMGLGVDKPRQPARFDI